MMADGGVDDDAADGGFGDDAADDCKRLILMMVMMQQYPRLSPESLLLRISCRAVDGECVRSYSHAVVVDMIESHDTQLDG
jgi:hypothetical protein